MKFYPKTAKNKVKNGKNAKKNQAETPKRRTVKKT